VTLSRTIQRQLFICEVHLIQMNGEMGSLIIRYPVLTVRILTVLIMSCGPVQERILSTSEKRWMEQVANTCERCIEI